MYVITCLSEYTCILLVCAHVYVSPCLSLWVTIMCWYPDLCVSIYGCVNMCWCVSLCIVLCNTCIYVYVPVLCLWGASLCQVMCGSLLILAHEIQLYSSLPNSVSHWAACNQPQREYLYCRNWEMLPAGTSPPLLWEPKHYQHLPAYHYSWPAVPKVKIEASLLNILNKILFFIVSNLWASVWQVQMQAWVSEGESGAHEVKVHVPVSGTVAAAGRGPSLGLSSLP